MSKSKLDNKKCILIEFVNSKEVATGYICWLKKDDIKNIDTIIDKSTEVEISWPNCDITSSVKLMNSRLQKAVFKNYTVVVLDQGTWESVKESEKKYTNKGVVKSTKSSRKINSKKVFTSDEEEDVTNGQENDPPKPKKTSAKKINKSVNQKLLGTISTLKKGILCEKQNVAKHQPNSSAALSSTSRGDDSNSEEQNLSDSDYDQIPDEDELQSGGEESPVIQATSKKSKDNLIPSLLQEVKDLRNSAPKASTSGSGSSTSTGSGSSTSKQHSKSHYASPKQSKDDLILSLLQEIKDLRNGSEASATTGNKRHSSGENERDPPSKKHKNKKVELGDNTGIFVSNYQFKSCNRGSVGLYTADLLALVFTREELGSSSITGETSNFNKNSEPKPPLDKLKLEAVKCQVLNDFGWTRDNTALFKKAVRDKLTNTASSLRREQKKKQNKNP